MSYRFKRAVSAALSLGLSAAPLACSGVADGEDWDLVDEGRMGVSTVPAKGTPQTLDIVEWNLEWFGHTGFGPTNETLQRDNIRNVIEGTDADIWAVVEACSTPSFNTLKSQLPGYSGFLANDPLVTQGSSYYTSSEQKVGILYKTDVVSVDSAKIILTGQNTNFAGRPPLEVKLTTTVDGAVTSFVLIIFHAKAMADADSYDRRKAAADALKGYLDSTYPADRVIVVGDFNDDLDTSIAGGWSPYKSLVDDTADYFFPTMAFTLAGKGTSASSSTPIDHHMITNEVVPLYVEGSAEVYKVNAYIASYTSTTSDHYPTITRYQLGQGGAPALMLNEICANEPGSATAGEFVEIVNVGSGPADLSGYTLSDAAGLKHTFAAGSTLAPGAGIVVFGGAAGIPAGLSNAVAASSGGLALANSGDTVTLKDGSGVVVDTFAYGSALAGTDGVSMNRNPDMTADGAWALHTTIAGLSSSPGKMANGSDF
ncbi:MAG: lamin tail domain-containing protein [Polyangiaceae bacterium]|nr:lamin tail domain-containing protein [Polyangiaceae bacterium]